LWVPKAKRRSQNARARHWLAAGGVLRQWRQLRGEQARVAALVSDQLPVWVGSARWRRAASGWPAVKGCSAAVNSAGHPPWPDPKPMLDL